MIGRSHAAGAVHSTRRPQALRQRVRQKVIHGAHHLAGTNLPVHRQPARQRWNRELRQHAAHTRPVRCVVVRHETDARALRHQHAVGDLVVGTDREAVAFERQPQRGEAAFDQVVGGVADQRVACQLGGFTASVLRAGDFFGAGTGNWFDQAIAKSLRAGKLVYPGPLDVPHAWAYLPDLARAFVRVAELPRVQAFQTWHFEGDTLTGAQLLAALEVAARELGVAPPQGFRHGGLPWGVISAIGLVVPKWRELARMAYLWRVPHALDGRSLAALSGTDQAVTPLAAALRESLLRLGMAKPSAHPAAV